MNEKFSRRKVLVAMAASILGALTASRLPNIKLSEAAIANKDKWLFIEIRDVSFNCNHNSFMFSESEGGAQNYIFNRVSWSNLKYGFRLRGGNNNSEFTFNQCGISGTVNTFLWSETSDQFL